jgi:hypothetical protein
MVKLHCGKEVAFGATGMKPESMPAVGVVMFWHGAAKVDWVAVWFLDWLVKIPSKDYCIGPKTYYSQLERDSVANRSIHTRGKNQGSESTGAIYVL